MKHKTNAWHLRPRSGRYSYQAVDGSITSVSWFEAKAINVNRVVSKAGGRRGTRRAWKLAHTPGWHARVMQQLFPEPQWEGESYFGRDCEPAISHV